LSLLAAIGALETGLIFGLVAMGVYLTFRVLDFPDLTVDGSFPLGAAVAAALIVGGHGPFSALIMATAAGALAGLFTAWLNQRFQILHLLASILTMIALFSINVRIMGKPNIALIDTPSVADPFLAMAGPDWGKSLALAVAAALIWALLARFLASDLGLALRATGTNARMARAQGVDTRLMTYAGLALSNGIVALAGGLFAQVSGFADVTQGTGTIVVGLAAVILGETLLPSRRLWLALIAAVAGSVLYRFAVALALDSDGLGLQSSDLSLVTAAIVALALMAPRLRAEWRAKRQSQANGAKAP